MNSLRLEIQHVEVIVVRERVSLIAGLIGALLGGLWFLQGIGAVHVRPILCFADCDVIQDRSPLWTIVGLVVLTAAVIAIANSIKRRHPR